MEQSRIGHPSPGRFSLSRVPALYFGPGALQELAVVLGGLHVGSIGIVCGGRSFSSSTYRRPLLDALNERGIEVHEASIAHEPDPDFINQTADDFRSIGVGAIVGIGGGSAIDAGKAVSTLISMGGKIEQYLEGVGTRAPDGRKIPFIAIPTTAGTGSEATKNAVITRLGPDGFKKSLRHDSYVPDVAIIDPELSMQCPPEVTAATGLDAITQLIEAYVSTGATAFTDALAENGLEAAANGFRQALRFSRSAGPASEAERLAHVDARANMAWAAYLSGICLANAGLGIVHGVASPLGARYPVPHGVVCGRLLPGSVLLTIRRLEEAGADQDDGRSDRRGLDTLERYARVARILGSGETGVANQCHSLVELLEHLLAEANLKRFSDWGVDEKAAADIARVSSGKTHPVSLTPEDIADLITECL